MRAMDLLPQCVGAIKRISQSNCKQISFGTVRWRADTRFEIRDSLYGVVVSELEDEDE